MKTTDSLMNSPPSPEHFVTLFDDRFLPLGLCLYQSLLLQGEPFCLWVITLDEQAEQTLLSHRLPHLKIIPLKDVENPDLLQIKKERTTIEYFWTLSPFTFQFVLDRDPDIKRVTYLDADLFFFGKPSLIFQELDSCQKEVLVTEHAFDPVYDQTSEAGRFCVQFITVTNSPNGRKIIHWWQQRCLEWCYNRVENGKFGDQRYLEHWPTLFPKEVHILQQKNFSLAPWNANYFFSRGETNLCFYHFHGLRITDRFKIRLSTHYYLPDSVLALYKQYVTVLCRQLKRLKKRNPISNYTHPILKNKHFLTKRRLKRIFKERTEFWAIRLPLSNKFFFI